jgi:hypothetical protein
LDKDPAILRVLDRLWSRLGPGTFVVTDHWEADLCAVGIASPYNHGVLAYISTHGEPPERFYVELELPPRPGGDFPYQAAGRFQALDFEQLASVIGKHLADAEPSDRLGS